MPPSLWARRVSWQTRFIFTQLKLVCNRVVVTGKRLSRYGKGSEWEIVVEPLLKLQTKKHAYLQHDVLSHAQTAPDKDAEATYLPEAALVTAMPLFCRCGRQARNIGPPRPTKASCIRCKKGAAVQKTVKESKNFLVARQEVFLRKGVLFKCGKGMWGKCMHR
jgi:hypothetical protein